MAPQEQLGYYNNNTFYETFMNEPDIKMNIITKKYRIKKHLTKHMVH